jgi:hypothetical protein
MGERVARDRFGGDLLTALRAAKAGGSPAGALLIDRLIWFLDKRLTDAAKGGCHHCGEGDKGTPCWWCGLRN